MDNLKAKELQKKDIALVMMITKELLIDLNNLCLQLL